MGSASCRDNDEYTRLDGLADWVDGVVELRGIERDRAGTQACGGITAQGRCLDGTALWCLGEKLVADICSRPGEQCGFDSRGGGFRCVDLRIPVDLGTRSAGTWALVPEHLGTIGAQRRVGPIGAQRRVDDQVVDSDRSVPSPFFFRIDVPFNAST